MVKITAIMKPTDSKSMEDLYINEYEYSKASSQFRNTKLATIKGLRTIFDKNLTSVHNKKKEKERSSK